MAAYIQVHNRTVPFSKWDNADRIVVEWLELKDAGKTHQVNVKHIIGKFAEVIVDGDIAIKLNSRLLCENCGSSGLDTSQKEKTSGEKENETSVVFHPSSCNVHTMVETLASSTPQRDVSLLVESGWLCGLSTCNCSSKHLNSTSKLSTF